MRPSLGEREVRRAEVWRVCSGGSLVLLGTSGDGVIGSSGLRLEKTGDGVVGGLVGCRDGAGNLVAAAWLEMV